MDFFSFFCDRIHDLIRDPIHDLIRDPIHDLICGLILDPVCDLVWSDAGFFDSLANYSGPIGFICKECWMMVCFC